MIERLAEFKATDGEKYLFMYDYKNNGAYFRIVLHEYKNCLTWKVYKSDVYLSEKFIFVAEDKDALHKDMHSAKQAALRSIGIDGVL